MLTYKHDKILLYNSIRDNIKLLGDLPKQWVDENTGITLKGLISSWILAEAFTTFSAWQSSYANYLDRLQPVHSTGEYFLEVRTYLTFFQKVGGSESTSCPTWTGFSPGQGAGRLLSSPCVSPYLQTECVTITEGNSTRRQSLK